MKDGVYDENQQDIVIQALGEAQKHIEIAVAWINFDEYYSAFYSALQKGVLVKIIVNQDVRNARYKNKIDSLCIAGLKFKTITPPQATSYMHHKFCIVDSKLCLMGSFNWTKNANENNFEDLLISHEFKLIGDCAQIFQSLWTLSAQDFNLLRNPVCCEACGSPIVNLCVFSQENENETRADIFQICGCDDFKYINSEFFTVHVYLNLISIYDGYSDEIEYYKENGYAVPENLELKFDYRISNYLSAVREQRMGMPIIHAVGVIAQRMQYKDWEERFINVIWKERYTSKYIQDEYPIS